jgi:hypothetical protein
MKNTKTNKYYFQGMRFVPGYNDFDWDDCVIEATSEKEAWDNLFNLTKRFTWKRVGLTHINDKKLETAIIPA